MTKLAVVIPVGPREHHCAYLGDTLASIAAQSRVVDHLVIVDDMHGRELDDMVCPPGVATFEVYRAPWHLGVAGAFNHGVMRAFAQGCDLALMQGADDTLEENLADRIVQTYETRSRADGYYWCEVQYSSGEQQSLPCNAAAVTPGFMRASGGLPIEASLGGMDAALISAMMVHDPASLIHVPGQDGGRVWVRQHAMQEGARLNRYGDAIVQVRNVFTAMFERPDWGRYA